MKYINRQQSPSNFETWKQKNNNANWNDFQGTDEYRAVKGSLICQQDNLCGYCEIVIQMTDSHIEHLKDKHNYPLDKFNYNNFIASCQHTDSCGHNKGTGYFPKFVSPFDNNCEQKFTYTRNGKIIPSDENDSDARDTINILGLNCKRLIDRRVGIIKTLENADNKYINDCLAHCVEWFYGFYTVIKYMQN